jgi:hypothetical protein
MKSQRASMFSILGFIAWVAACSANDGASLLNSAGSGGNGAGGSTVVDQLIVDAGADPTKDWGDDATATPDGGTSNLFAPDGLAPLVQECDPVNDLCSCAAFEWPVADADLHNINMNTGDYVTLDGHLYEFIGVVQKPVDWPRPECIPSNPTGADCGDGKWWKDTGIDCPVY